MILTVSALGWRMLMLHRLVCVDWLSGSLFGDVRKGQWKYIRINIPHLKHSLKLRYKGIQSKIPLDREFMQEILIKHLQEAMWRREKHSGFWGPISPSADNLFCELDKWLWQHKQQGCFLLCKMRSRTTWPLHAIHSCGSRSGQWSYRCRRLTCPDPYPLGSRALSHYHQSGVDTEWPEVG